MKKSELHTIVTAAAFGALGHCSLDLSEDDDNPAGLLNSMGLEDWFRFIAGLRQLLTEHLEVVRPHAFEIYALHKFETVSEAVEHLWKHAT